ncbi:MAG: hypothetical protein M1834_002990 [Cirrosporium novae-zelandiae]|nr:MAG: hypothetical protein M1834_002990 [Cirrosporium novae-zelandiae]
MTTSFLPPKLHHFAIAILLAIVPLCSAVPSNPLGIDWGPAPSPEDGPPLSANASRNKGLLPIQISCIVGAYIICVFLLLALLFTVGRRLRRAAEASLQSLDMEMMKPPAAPIPKTFDQSPISPLRSETERTPTSAYTPNNRSPLFPSPDKAKSTFSWDSLKKGHRKGSSAMGSVSTFDENVIEEDRVRAQREMDRLYAAVAEYEDEQEARIVNGEEAQKSPKEIVSPKETAPPPELAHLCSQPSKDSSPVSPTSPKAATSSTREVYPTSPSRESTRSRMSKPSPLSFLNPSRNSVSTNSSRNHTRRRSSSVRNLPISQPIGSPDLGLPNRNSDTEPLSPRTYNPGPPPIPPEDRKPPQVHGLPASPRSPKSPTAKSPTTKSPRSPLSPLSPRLRLPTLTTKKSQQKAPPPPPLPLQDLRPGAYPTTTTQRSPTNPPPTAISTSPQTPSFYPSPMAPAFPSPNRPARSPMAPTFTIAPTHTRTSLPLRSPRFQPPSSAPASQTTYNHSHNHTIQTTILERRISLHPSARTPRTGGVPATPYSPYMPRTPITPITPGRLVGRKERKMLEKESRMINGGLGSGRRALGKEDLVPEEGEMWGEGW